MLLVDEPLGGCEGAYEGASEGACESEEWLDAACEEWLVCDECPDDPTGAAELELEVTTTGTDEVTTTGTDEVAELDATFELEGAGYDGTMTLLELAGRGVDETKCTLRLESTVNV